MAHLVEPASRLLGTFVGETETNIANAFAEAKRENALLQFDEVDSFLSERNHAVHSWQVSMVNEMMTQMDTFDGIFIASTNRFDHLDEAALRRFDANLQFDFMRPEQAWTMSASTCSTFGLALHEAHLAPQLRHLRHVTPGDFAQLVRQHQFLPFRDASAVMDALSKAGSHKKSAVTKPMGFLRAA